MSTFRWAVFVAITTTLGACRPTSCAEHAPAPVSSSARVGCACASSTSAPVPARPADPFAPVLVPGPDRPHALKSTVLSGIQWVSSATPFRSPSAAHAEGTFLLGVPQSSKPAQIVEVDIATRSIVGVHDLPAAGSFVRVAATNAGIAVAVDERYDASDQDIVFVLDDAFRQRERLEIQGHGTNVHADGKLAIVGSTSSGSSGAELTALELPSGRTVGTRHVGGSFSDEWVPTAQVMVHGDRIFALSRGQEHYVLHSFSRDLRRPLAAVKMAGSELLTKGPMGMPGPHHGDGLLTSGPSGIVVVREDSIDLFDFDLAPELPVKLGMGRSPAIPGFDSVSNRVLFANGDGAKSLSDERTERAVAFRRDLWKWSSDGEVPLYYDEPFAAFFVGGRGVILTQHPEVRVTVLEWKER